MQTAKPPGPAPPQPTPQLDPGRDLIVVAALKAPEAMVARAQQVAVTLGARWVPRDRGIKALLRRYGARLAYVVTHEREAVDDGDQSLFMHPGLFYLKRGPGRSHPLIRAISPEQAAPLTSVLDGTLGMANDALHLAEVLGCPVVGVEASPVLACLVDEGLRRVAGQRRRLRAAIGRLSVRCAQTLEVLRGMPDDAIDAIFLDPMFEQPLDAPPGFDLLRRLADPTPLSEALLFEAARVARRRVVVKVAGASPPPSQDAPAPGWSRRIRGTAVDYHVIEWELPPAFGSEVQP